MSVKKSVLEQFDNRKLESYILPGNTYLPQAVRYAVEILQKRGRIFAADEQLAIEAMIGEKEQQEKLEALRSYSMDINVTDEETAIQLYSRTALWFFGLFAGFWFAVIMLAINFHKLGIKKGMAITLVFGIAYWTVSILLLEYFKDYIRVFSYGGGLATGILGVTILHAIWTRYMPLDLKYRPKSILNPLIIAIVFTLIYLLILFGGLGH